MNEMRLIITFYVVDLYCKEIADLSFCSQNLYLEITRLYPKLVKKTKNQFSVKCTNNLFYSSMD